MTEQKAFDQVSHLVCEVVPEAKPSGNAAPMEFLLLESRDGFPEGRAAAAALRLIGRGLVEAKAHVTVLLPKPGEPSACILNPPHIGLYEGMRFEFTCGTATRSSHFFTRRRDALRGFVVLWLRLIQKRMACGRKGLCVYLYGEAPFLCLPVLLLSKLLRFPVIVELCEWKAAFTSANRLSNWYHRLRVRLADGVLAISEDLERKATAILPAPRKRNVLLHSILADVNEAAVERLQLEIMKGPYVLWCGDFEGYIESVIWLIRCCAVAFRRVEDLKLVLVGPLRDSLRLRLLGEIGAAGLSENQVIPTGYVSRRELWTLYSGAVALLAPLDSSERSQARFPWKIAEYLAAGRPVITNGVGEITRYFTDGENALVARPDDEEDFVSKIELIAKNRALGDRIGAAGRELALRHFHYAAYGRRLLRFVNGLSAPGDSNFPGDGRFETQLGGSQTPTPHRRIIP
jgi:glycosyltransferase involved in cell wall biosynthesis